MLILVLIQQTEKLFIMRVLLLVFFQHASGLFLASILSTGSARHGMSEMQLMESRVGFLAQFRKLGLSWLAFGRRGTSNVDSGLGFAWQGRMQILVHVFLQTKDRVFHGAVEVAFGFSTKKDLKTDSNYLNRCRIDGVTTRIRCSSGP